MFINIFGKKIYYEMYGAEYKDTLLYLHGGPGASCLDFVNQAKALSEKRKIILFDQLGVLRSEAIDENEDYGMEYQIEMIEEMRKLFEIEKWSILGHSYGGMLAVLYAYMYQDCVDKVILECPSLCFEDSARSVAEYLSEHIHSLGDKQASELCEKIKSAKYRDKRESVYDLIGLLQYVTDMKLLETGPMPNAAFGKRVTMTDNFLPMIQRITLPVLLLNGRYDPACTMCQTEYIIGNVQNVTQVIFENSGHFPRIEEADKYTNTIFDFLLK